MTNREFYKEQIEEIMRNLLLSIPLGVDKKTGIPCGCHMLECADCSFEAASCGRSRKEWLEAEHKEPAIDWSKVPVDTKILVRDGIACEWLKRHFAKYDGKQVFTWTGGGTSFSSSSTVGWRLAKLYKEEGK